VLTLRGLVLFLCGRLPQALQHTQSALRYDPGHEPAQRLRKRVKDVERLKEEGNQAFKLGKLHEALRLYTEALEVCVSLFFALLNLIPVVSYSGSAKTRTKERAVSCARCYCLIVPLPSSKYVVTTYFFHLQPARCQTNPTRKCSSPATTTPSSTRKRPSSSNQARSKPCAHARGSGCTKSSTTIR
jgi:hypothetical protein